MKAIKNIFTVLLLALMVTFGGRIASANEFNFSISPVLPKNQADENVTYYDLLLKQGEKQILTIQLQNSTDKKVTVEGQVASATTNVNGVVEYSPNQNKSDKTLQYNLKDFVKMPKEIVLEPKKTKTIDVEVTMPNASFKGIIAGGLTFKQKSSETDPSSKDQKGLALKNEYAYVIALLMREDKEIVKPELILNEVEPSQVNYRNIISANLQNPTMGYLNQMKIDANVKGIDDSSISYSSVKEMMQMAPNTNFEFPVPLNGNRLKPGKYHLSMDIFGEKDPNGQYVSKNSKGQDEHYKYKWHFDRDFTITGKQAQNLNAKDVTVKPDNSWIIWIIIAGVLLVIALLFFFILWKRRKKDKEEKQKTELSNEK
ncbi:DUF916 and DUF3324 domain-containing protein [Bacillus thuringiensis]|uniref:DUF916 and DUF3324 domain-containing protein n=1 Tax=Bacillus thuringiensis TaxID=1428 RepID=UPI000CD952C6|nr:DUF916 and DUF3324 domain-containing protein [Bacillus thuringiensis]